MCDKEGAVQVRLNDKSAVDSHVDGGWDDGEGFSKPDD